MEAVVVNLKGGRSAVYSGGHRVGVYRNWFDAIQVAGEINGTCPLCRDPKDPREQFCRPCSLDMRCECGAELVIGAGTEYVCPQGCER